MIVNGFIITDFPSISVLSDDSSSEDRVVFFVFDEEVAVINVLLVLRDLRLSIGSPSGGILVIPGTIERSIVSPWVSDLVKSCLSPIFILERDGSNDRVGMYEGQTHDTFLHLGAEGTHSDYIILGISRRYGFPSFIIIVVERVIVEGT